MKKTIIFVIIVLSLALSGLNSMVLAQAVPSIIDINDGTSYSGASKTLHATTYIQATCSLAYSKNSDTSNGTTVLGGVVQTPAVGNDQKYYYAFNLTGLDGVSVYYYKIMCTASGQSDISTIKTLSPITTNKVYNGDGTYDINAGDRVKLNNGATIEPVYYISGDFLNIKFDVYNSSLIKIGSSDFTRAGWPVLKYSVSNYNMEFKVNSAGSSAGKYFGNIVFTSVSANAFEITSVSVDKLDATGNPAEDVRSFGINANQQFTNLQIMLYELPSTTVYFTLNQAGSFANVYVSPGNWPKKLNPNKTYNYIISAKSVTTSENDSYEGSFTTSNFFKITDVTLYNLDSLGNPAEDVRTFSINASHTFVNLQITLYELPSTTAYFTLNESGPFTSVGVSPGNWPKKLNPNKTYRYVITAKSVITSETDTYESTFTTSNFIVTPGTGTSASTQITILTPNGGEKFVQGNLNRISWSGGTEKVQIGILKGTSMIADSTTDLLGWINTNLVPNSSTYWDGKKVCDLIGTTCWGLAAGSYKIVGGSKDKDGNFLLSYPGNFDMSDNAFSLSSASIPTTTEQENIYIQRIKELEYRITELENQVTALAQNAFTRLNEALVNRVLGRILLQVETNGQAWYMDPVTEKKYYLKDGNSAYIALNAFGLGVTNSDLSKIPVGVESRFQMADGDGDGLPDNLERAIGTNPGDSDSDDDGFSDGEEVKNGYNPLAAGKLTFDYNLANKLRGKILLQVQSRGEAWYVSPVDSKRYYLGDGESAYQIMRYLSLGITNADLNEIPTGSLNY